MTGVSVIIPTHNRAASLRTTLESFSKVDYPKSELEIIVVDNASSDETRDVVQSFIQRCPGIFSYHFEPRLGVHFARNRGLQLARFDLTYFTDDDMEIDPQALAELVQPFLIYPRLGLCTGRVMPRWSIQPDDWVLKYMANHNLSLLDRPEHMVVSAIDVGVYSCHEMARKQALIEAGGFHPELTGDIYVGDGESGVNAEVLRNGYLSAYISSAVTYHCIPAGRLTQAYFNKRLANQGRADAFTSFRNDPTNGQCRFLFAQCRPIAAIAKNAVLGFMFRVLGKDAWHFKAAMRHYWQAKVSHASQLRRDPELMRLAQADSYLDP